jgi:hypothetical protein
MDRAFIAISKDGPAPGTDKEDRSRRCSPSEVLVHYFLDDLSSTQKRDLTDHLSGCDLCSARLLALEISAAVGLDHSRSSAGAIIAGRGPKAEEPYSTRETRSWRNGRRRTQRTTAVSVVTLDDRELLTGIAMPVDLGALARVARIEPLEMAVPRLSTEPRSRRSSGGIGVSVLHPTLCDLAISELIGSESFGAGTETSFGGRVAA